MCQNLRAKLLVNFLFMNSVGIFKPNGRLDYSRDLYMELKQDF